MIYFIKCGNRIKIGVSERPWERMAHFQTSNPERLEMLAVGPGDAAFERELHRLFGKSRVGGEWFRDNKRVRDTVAFLRSTFPELQKRPRRQQKPLSLFQESQMEPKHEETDTPTCPECGCQFDRAGRAQPTALAGSDEGSD